MESSVSTQRFLSVALDFSAVHDNLSILQRIIQQFIHIIDNRQQHENKQVTDHSWKSHLHQMLFQVSSKNGLQIHINVNEELQQWSTPSQVAKFSTLACWHLLQRIVFWLFWYLNFLCDCYLWPYDGMIFYKKFTYYAESEKQYWKAKTAKICHFVKTYLGPQKASGFTLSVKSVRPVQSAWLGPQWGPNFRKWKYRWV